MNVKGAKEENPRTVQPRCQKARLAPQVKASDKGVPRNTRAMHMRADIELRGAVKGLGVGNPRSLALRVRWPLWIPYAPKDLYIPGAPCHLAKDAQLPGAPLHRAKPAAPGFLSVKTLVLAVPRGGATARAPPPAVQKVEHPANTSRMV